MFLHLFKNVNGREICYYIELKMSLGKEKMAILNWLLGDPVKTSKISNGFEVGPRMSWVSPWASTVQSILNSIGLDTITRIEYSIRSKESFPYDKMTNEEYTLELSEFEHRRNSLDESEFAVSIDDFKATNNKYSLGFDEQDMQYYRDLFEKEYRLPRLIELYDLAQCNSEHCRHWFFNGKLIIDGEEQDFTLFDLVKRPYKANPGKSLLAFCDNASVREGYDNLHLTFKAETHNFPTGISPYPGAETGVGGRQRDSMTVGCGGTLLAGTAGYCVGNLGLLSFERQQPTFKSQMATPVNILLEASNGVSEYGNKFGEPLVQGFCRTFGIDNTSWVKPILFSGGVGQIRERDIQKGKPEPKQVIVKLGGPAYRIGMGGSTSSSKSDVSDDDFDAVQRGDPLMNQKVYRVIRACTELERNPIVTISDQGAGGNANVLKELIEGVGAVIQLVTLNIGDDSMTPLELWVAEYQEAVALVINREDIPEFQEICERESCPHALVGYLKDTGRMEVLYKNKVMVDLPLKEVLEDLPQKTYHLQTTPKNLTPLRLPEDTFGDMLGKVLRLPAVASKNYLVTKADRSVGGLVVQQQCVGPLQVPVSDYALMAQDFKKTTGVVTSIGEKPLLSLIDPAKMARMAVAEALTNLIMVQTDGLENIKLSANWMWPDKDANLVKACKSLSDFCMELGVVIDGGKDSLSMRVKTDHGEVNAPGSLVISAYTFCPDIRKRVTPQLSPNGEPIYLLHFNSNQLGGSALAQVYNQVGDECLDVNPSIFKTLFNFVQNLIKDDIIIAAHDRSDGGLITTLLEMCFAGNCGMKLDLELKDDPTRFLFNEGIGIVIQTKKEWRGHWAWYNGFDVTLLGKSANTGFNIHINKEPFYFNDIKILHYEWERVSFLLDQKQANPETAKEELSGIITRKNPKYKVTYELKYIERPILNSALVAVLRTEGTNGHREMAAAFGYVGFPVLDVHTNDLLKDPSILDKCKGLVFPGGFSFSDSLGAGKGFAALLKYNEPVKNALARFYKRHNTFSLGVCNGFQLLCHIDVFPRVKLVKNRSQRFESRLTSVKISKSNCIFFKDMVGSVLPVCCAHAEGKVLISKKTSVPWTVEYVNDDNEPTSKYPFSPNGTALAGVCTLNGRHLGMMPHPERSFLDWQLPHNPQKWKVSPWLKMFQNAYDWTINPKQVTIDYMLERIKT